MFRSGVVLGALLGLEACASFGLFKSAPRPSRARRRLGAVHDDDDDSAEGAPPVDDDEALDLAFRARVEELGGPSGVKARVAAKKLKRDVRVAVEDKGRSVQKFLDLDSKNSYAPGSTADTTQLLSLGGWATTVGLLGLVVVLALVQSFRIDPANYT